MTVARVLAAPGGGAPVQRHRLPLGATPAPAADAGDGWCWLDLVRPGDDDVRRALAALGLDEASVPATSFAAVGRVSDACGWLAWGPWGMHLALGIAGPGPEYAVRRSLHVLSAGRTIVTVRDRPWPALAQAVRRLARGDAAGRELARELAADPSALVALLVAPVVDNARGATRAVVDRAEAIARRTIRRPAADGLWTAILNERRDLLTLRRRYAPLVRTLRALDQVAQVGRLGRARLRDLADRLSDSVDTMDMVREGMSSTAEAYASIQANEINRVMKVLTLVSVLFLPATLIASVYGMNFRMPELGWPGGYAYSLTLMVVVTAALLAFLRRHGWL